jgi:hypothetical protein
VEKSLHVFVCSTYRDLVSERNAVLDGLEWLRTQFPSVTYFCPRNILPLDVCKEEIRRSDVLVLILGHLHGVIAPGLDIPHGEAEYREGIALGKKVLVFLRDEKVGIYPVHFERDPQRIGHLKAFKEEVRDRHGAKTFGDLQGLVNQVNLGLSGLAVAAGLEPKPGSKTAPMKIKGWETRKVPMYAGTTSVDLIPNGTGDNATRTIPVLQKALTQPFRHRKSSSPSMGKVMVGGFAFMIAAVLMLAWINKRPFSRAVSLPPSTSAGSPTTQEPLSDAGAADAGVPGGKAAAQPPKPEGAVVMMEDPDTINTLILRAKDGTPQEQFHVGRLYEEGTEVLRNDTTAFRWYKKAAEQGMAEAQHKVALMYRWGKGTVKSSSQAARWFQQAAENGHPKAQVQLGRLYRTGRGVPRNETMAFKWFLKAADQKDPEAERILAELKQD